MVIGSSLNNGSGEGELPFIIGWVILPAQQNAVVESVSKGLNVPTEFRRALGLGEMLPPLPPRVPFTPLAEIEKALQRHIACLNLPALVQQSFADSWDRLRGRV